MEKLKLKSGSRVGLVINGEKNKDFSLTSTFERNINSVSFLISVPMAGGKRVEADPQKKLLMKYEMGGSSYVVEGYVDEELQEGRRHYWKIRKVNENRAYFQRTDERIKAELDVTFTKRWWNPDGTDSAEEVKGLTMDVSAGGLAMFTNVPLNVGEMVDMTLPPVGKKRKVSVSGETCWFRETEKGNAFRYTAGLKFVFINPKDKDKLYKYVDAVGELSGDS
ncbi:PilZ domain-containing protein [Bacilliculturomica massiliensis]|uniref:PilZ domain-containing protein n=1 Tax=Bacilliculturomica massiliensis TaxID=1917867 RepID=UPI00103190B6|nr:PilZ domain-containing protein [Bacilliculturomica massiliensis]